MKNLLYVGNYLQNNKTNASYMHTLGSLLRNQGYTIVMTSSKENKVLRILDMIFVFLNNKKQIDYVLIDTYSTYNFYYTVIISWLCRSFNRKYITLLHGGNLPHRLQESPKLSKQVFNNAFLNVAPSIYIKEHFVNFGFKNVQFIPNTLQLNKYTFLKRDYNSIKLLWVRSFSKIYNPKMAVAVLKNLIEKGYKTELCMVGPDTDGSLKKVKDYAKQLHLEVTFTGKLTKEEWILIAKNYNIFMNTTNFDNMPLSVIEAMALGLPVVSTNVGGMPYLIRNNEDGILTAPEDANKMADAIIKLFNEEETIEKLTRNARSKVENFDWSKVKKQWISVLK